MASLGTIALTGIPPLLERAKIAFVLALRAGFKSDLTDKDLLYSQDANATKIKIYRAQPKRLEFFPCLVISTSSGDASFTYMNDDFVEQTVDPVAVTTFNGKVVFTISVTVSAGSTQEREKIIDHLIFFIRHIFRANIHGFGLEYTKDIRVGPETTIEVDNEPVYQQVMDIPCYLEYEVPVDQGMLDTIRAINISITTDTTFEAQD